MGTDSKRRTLVIEGGGMRGAYCAGVLDAWWEAGVRFDAIYGSSSGACTAAFWAAGQPSFRHIWGDALHGDRLIRYRKLFMPGPVLDLPGLIYRIFAEDYGLKAADIQASATQLFISATRCRDGSAHFFDCHESGVDVFAALHCGAALPFAHPLPVWYGDEPYADGSLASPVPVQAALASEADEYWIVLTRPKGFRKPPMRASWLPRWAYRRYPALAQSVQEQYRVYNEQLEMAEALVEQGRARVVQPDAGLAIGRLTRDRAQLQAAIAAGQADGRASLD